jgi:hypothetical protein
MKLIPRKILLPQKYKHATSADNLEWPYKEQENKIVTRKCAFWWLKTVLHGSIKKCPNKECLHIRFETVNSRFSLLTVAIIIKFDVNKNDFKGTVQRD